MQGVVWMGKNKKFVWYGLRIGFWVMIIGWTVITLLRFAGISYWKNIGIAITGLIYSIASIFVFVTSIVHLTKYSQKAFAITSLVISFIMILLWVMGTTIGLISRSYYAKELLWVEQQTEDKNYYYCAGICSTYANLGFVSLNRTAEGDTFCYCEDEAGNIINKEQVE